MILQGYVLGIGFFAALLMVPLHSYGRCSRVCEPRSRTALFSSINGVEMVVVQLCGCRSRECKEQSCKQMKQLLRQRLHAVNQNQRFAYAGVSFYLMDISPCPDLVQDLTLERVPVLILFFQGKPVKDGSFLARLEGLPTEIEINEFIDSYFNQNINEVIADRSEHDKDVEQAKMAAWAAWGPYWYGGYYRPCYSNWGMGCGWGFNGCW